MRTMKPMTGLWEWKITVLGNGKVKGYISEGHAGHWR